MATGTTIATSQRSLFYDLCHRLVPRPRIEGRGCCLRLPPEIVRDPDPATYDQRLELAAGRLPSFNSPDIDTVRVWPIRPIDTLNITVRNLSPDASANGTRVDVSWSPWGIGMPRQAIASKFVNLPRAGFPGSQQRVQIPTPAAVIEAGRYGIFATIHHPYDRDLSNNSGDQVLDGFATSETRSKQFVIPVRNSTGSAGNVQLQVSPNTWGATIVPSTLVLGAGAQQDTQFSVTVPAGVPPSPAGILVTQSFEISALLNGTLIGGVAIIVLVDG